MRIGLIGTRGVPARYGGFETCVEEVGSRLAGAGHDVVVYCRNSNQVSDDSPRPRASGGSGSRKRSDGYRGMSLVHLPAVPRRSAETLSHTALSIGHVITHRVDVAIVFNAANAPLLPALRSRRIPIATHVDGLEWQRAKWGGAAKRYYRSAESLAVRWSDALIADSEGIGSYYQQEFGAPTEVIAYGAPSIRSTAPERIRALDLEPDRYHLVVARFEPENHVDVIVRGYVGSRGSFPLVVVGSAPYAAEHTATIRALADGRVRFLGAVWDQTLLDELYACAFTYLHGHSVGGTNPSLLRAIGAGSPTDAFDVSFNREVLGGAGRYWSTPEDVARLIESAERDVETTAARGEQCRERARAYDWDEVADAYGDLCRRLHAGELRRPPNTGRRRR